MKARRSTELVEKKDFYKELFSLAIPIGMQNLLVALIGASDALMLGRLTQDAVSAVSLANQIAFIMSLFSGAVVGGGGALIAQYWGKGDWTMVKNLFCMLIKWAFGISFVFFALAMFAPELLMRIYTPDTALIKIGASYLRAVSLSYLFTGVTQCYYLIMKLEGKAPKSVLISVVTLITDVVLDFFLIYGFAGVPKLGANGSAYSTVVVELVALIWCIAESHRGESIRPDLQGFQWFSIDITKDLFKIALPMLGSSLAWGFGFSMHSLIMGHLGSDATAAASIASVAQELITCVCKGISVGAGIMVGKLLGQNLFDKAKEYGKKFCHISIWAGIVHMALLCILGPIVAEFFVLSETAKHYLVIMLVFSAFYVFAYSINTVIVCGIFPAGGDAGYDALSVFFASWCFALPLALLGTFVFHWPVIVVYILMCADEIVKIPWLYPRYKKYLWLNNLTREESSVMVNA
ncbi:MAG: MATE family efflux transporter [Blautia sp.]|uniref:MATE family efflux transporter n=1 Tax=unclassified Blautia TaxID=2648079 RepID=UPI001FD44963|nr:MATE family efflux transporter [Blautia sp. NSJ-175]MCJ7844301.1 MATE family efflux transporter [Blautia sp. NSJ-175]